MLHKTFLFHGLMKKRHTLLLACAFSILCFAQAVEAQSGRRPAKSTSPSPPVVAPEATDEPKAGTAKPAPVATLLVGGDRLSASFDLHPGFLDVALHACIERLEKSAGLAVNSGGSSMIRKEAIDAAKRQKDGYVVWLEMKVERYSTVSTGVTLEYTVLTPETAKVKTFGRVYLEGSRQVGGGVGVGVPSISRRIPLEYLAKDAGRTVAERVLDSLKTGALSK